MPKSFIGNNGRQYRFEKDITQEEFDSYYAKEVGNQPTTKPTTESIPAEKSNQPITFRDKALNTFLNSVISTLPSNSKYYDDPTTMGFTLFFEFEGRNSPLFNESDDGESAIRYLKNIGENRRAAHLKRFKQRLYDVTKFYPYFYQKIKGLEGIYKFESGKPFEPRTLTVETLESIDLRIGSLASEYMDAFYDIRYKREMIPINLIRFKCHVLVTEIKKFRTYVGENTSNQTDEMNMIRLNDFLSYYWLTFNECNFDFSDSLPFMGDLSISAPETANGLFKIYAPTFITRNKMKLLDLYNPTIDTDKPHDINNSKVEQANGRDPNWMEQKPEDTSLKGKLKKLGQDKLDDLKQTGLSVYNGVAQTAQTAAQQKGSEYLQKYDPLAKVQQLAFKGLDYLDNYLKDALFGLEIDNPSIDVKTDLGSNKVANESPTNNNLSTITTSNVDIIHELATTNNDNQEIPNRDLSSINVVNQTADDVNKTVDVYNQTANSNIADTNPNNDIIPNRNLDSVDVDNAPSIKSLMEVDVENLQINGVVGGVDVNNPQVDAMDYKTNMVNNRFDPVMETGNVNTKNNIIPDNINLVSNTKNQQPSALASQEIDASNKFQTDAITDNITVSNSDTKKVIGAVDINNPVMKQEEFPKIKKNPEKFRKFEGFVEVSNKKPSEDLVDVKASNTQEDGLGNKQVVVDNDLVKLMRDQLKDFNERPVTSIIDESVRSNLGNIITNNDIVS